MENAIPPDVAKELLSWAQGAKGFVLDQAPQVAQEIVRFGRAKETAEFATASLFAVASVAFLCWAMRSCIRAAKHRCFGSNGEEDWFYGPRVFGSIAAVIVGMFSTIEALLSLSDLCMAWVSPRLYIIRHLADLAK